MKRKYALLLLVLTSLALSSCAPTQETNTSKNIAPSPPTEKVMVLNAIQGNEKILRELIPEKIKDMSYRDLVRLSTFIDYVKMTSGDPTREILVLLVEKNGFPEYLEKILLSQKNLRKVPRKLTSLVKIESNKVKGVFITYIKIPAEYISEKTVSVYDWMPELKDWLKYVNLKECELSHLSPENAFLVLFWMGNKVTNPEFASVLKKNNFIWDKMPNPKYMGDGSMYIPIYTIIGSSK